MQTDPEFLLWLHHKLVMDGADPKLGYMQRILEIAVKAQRTLQPLLTEKEVAKRYGLVEETIKNWRYNNSGGPPYLKLKGSVKYRQEDLETWELTRLKRSGS